eukprot:IDg14342t1
METPTPRKAPYTAALMAMLARFGPMCLVSVAALDPGNLEVDVQAGARARYTLMWAVMYASVCGALLQNAAAQLAVVTRLHLAELCALEYADAPVVRTALVVIAQLSVIAFDMAEVLGIALALQLLCKWPLWLGCVASAADTLLILHLQRRGQARLEFAIEALLLVLIAAIVYELAVSRPDVSAIVHAAAVPSLGSEPRRRARSRDAHDLPSIAPGSDPRAPATLQAECRETTVDTTLVFVGAFIVNGAVLAVSAALFYPRRAEPAFQNIGLKEASALLHDVLGHTEASRLFSLATRGVAIVPAVAAALAAGARGADRLIVASQIILSFALPFAAVPAIRFLNATHSRSRWLVAASCIAFTLVAVANVAATVAAALDELAAHSLGGAMHVMFVALGVAYMYVLGVLFVRPLRLPQILERRSAVRSAVLGEKVPCYESFSPVSGGISPVSKSFSPVSKSFSPASGS